MKHMFNYIYLSTLEGLQKVINMEARWNCELTCILEEVGILRITKRLNHAKALMRYISNN